MASPSMATAASAAPLSLSYARVFHDALALDDPTSSLASDPNAAAFQDRLHRTLTLLRQALGQRQRDGVLSDNEPFSELQTSQLHAFCLEYFLAMLLPKLTFVTAATAEDDREAQFRARIQCLKEADVFHTQFLDRAERIRLLTDGKRREQYERIESKRFGLSREVKIERFKMQRELETRLKAVQERRMRMQEAEDEEGEEEEVEREQLLTFIQLAVVKAMEEQASINQEREMLETMVQMNAKTDKHDLFTDAHRAKPPPQGQGVSVTHINRNFEMRRETIRSQVFQPDHRLPTMSLEEYADREMADAQARQEKEAQGSQGPRRYDQLEADGDEDNMELVEEATLKDRAWDDWKDAHPRGMGNKKGSQF